jgi:hypothetical protein
MANTFPGVNPYIEAGGRWTGFHNLLIAACSELLNSVLPENYAAFVEERLEVVDLPGERPDRRQPDLAVARDVYTIPATGTSTQLTLDIEPATLTLPDSEISPEAYIDIRSLPDQELVTSIEILSPTNKDATGHGGYWHKRNGMIRQGVHLVEIDLLLEGRRLDVKEALPTGDFYAFVSRGEQRPKCQVFAWSILRSIPRLPIPLKSPDPDVLLDLQSAFNSVVDRNRYEKTLRYEVPLSKSLSEQDRRWVEALVRDATG